MNVRGKEIGKDEGKYGGFCLFLQTRIRGSRGARGDLGELGLC